MTPAAAAKGRSKFDPLAFLSTIDRGRRAVTFAKKQRAFVQGGPADAVFYIRKGER
jgi:CRP/FNR family cyclic AMP-dependent transcriptional regulator